MLESLAVRMSFSSQRSLTLQACYFDHPPILDLLALHVA